MRRLTLDAIIHRDGRVRPVWRIALFFVCFFLLTLVGQYIVSVLPRHPLQWGSLIAMTTAALIAGWIVLSQLDRRPFGALGFPLNAGAARESLLGLGIGGGLLAAAVLLLLLTGSARFTPDEGSAGGYLFFLGWTLLFFAIAACFEEAIFRGYPFQVLVEWIGTWPAVVAASLLFALLHAQNPNVSELALVNIFLAGVLLSIAYLRTRSLWFATSLHLGWNWAMAGLFDFPVSGLTFDTPLYDGVPIGSEWWTGGAFGPEAGLVGTVVLITGTVALLRARSIAPSQATTSLGPIVDRRLTPGQLR